MSNFWGAYQYDVLTKISARTYNFDLTKTPKIQLS